MRTIDHDKFFDIFSKKYNFNKMEQLKHLLKETISITREIKQDMEIEVGRSKFGGRPDLPKDMKYPYYNDEIPYSFIMQINCAELTHLDKNNVFPSNGMIYVFHLFEDEAVALDFDFEGDFEGFLKTNHIFHYDGDVSTLGRTARPKSEHVEKIKAAEISFVFNYTLPRPYEQEEQYLKLGFTQEELSASDGVGEIDLLHSALSRLPYELEEEVLEGDLESFYEQPFHQLLGEPEFYQGPPNEEIEYRLKETFDDEDEAKIKRVLFAQIFVDEDINLWWAADGAMYYYIKEKDLKNRKYDSIYGNMQCG